MAEKKDAAEETSGDGGSKKKLIIIIGAVLLVVLIGGGVAAFLLLGGKKEVAQQEDPTLNVTVPEISQKTEIGPMLKIDEFIVNIISEDNNHYVKAALSLELSNETVLEEATNRIPQIRDAVLLMVGNKTFEELQDLQGKKQLKAELISKINSFLQSGKVHAIYFTDFVVQ